MGILKSEYPTRVVKSASYKCILIYSVSSLSALKKSSIWRRAPCWNLLVASSAAARISDGLTRRFVYACYLDVDIVYNRSYIDCTSTRLPRSPPTSCTLVGPAPRISIARMCCTISSNLRKCSSQIWDARRHSFYH